MNGPQSHGGAELVQINRLTERIVGIAITETQTGNEWCSFVFPLFSSPDEAGCAGRGATPLRSISVPQ